MDPICELDPSGYCKRHQEQHSGKARQLALDPGSAGEKFRIEADARLKHKLQALSGKLAIQEVSPGAPEAIVGVEGIGNILKNLLAAKGVHATPNCRCAAVINVMNQIGVEGVKKDRNRFLTHLRDTSAEFGWATKINAGFETLKSEGIWGALVIGARWLVGVEDPYEWLLNEAIRIAENQEGTKLSTLVTTSPAVTTPPKYQGKLDWAYGVTTIPLRRESHLPRTLASLAKAGFDNPRLFVDGFDTPISYRMRFGLDVTVRDKIDTWPNWYLALAELYFRQPTADRYAIFQDDIVVVKNLRAYLEELEYPEWGYWNLITEMENELVIRDASPGEWRESFYLTETEQAGRGACALVFDVEAATKILTRRCSLERIDDPVKGRANVDGAVVTAMNLNGCKEYVHRPSLVQHTGTVSTIPNFDPNKGRDFPPAETFPGEDFDALSLLPTRQPVEA